MFCFSGATNHLQSFNLLLISVVFSIIVFISGVEALIDGNPVMTAPDWMVSLRTVDENNPNDIKITHKCSGVLLTKEWILTSAFCVTENSLLKVVYLGNSDANNVNSKYATDILQVIKHSLYEKGSRKDDLALVKIASADLQPIVPVKLSQLADTSRIPQATLWSYTTQGYNDKRLRQSIQNVVQDKFCEGYNGWNSDQMLCLGSTKNNVNSNPENIKITYGPCYTDDGGPVIQVINNQVELTGIISNGHARCKMDGTTEKDVVGSPEEMIISTQLYPYRSWIESTANIKLHGSETDSSNSPSGTDTSTATKTTGASTGSFEQQYDPNLETTSSTLIITDSISSESATNVGDIETSSETTESLTDTTTEETPTETAETTAATEIDNTDSSSDSLANPELIHILDENSNSTKINEVYEKLTNEGVVVPEECADGKCAVIKMYFPISNFSNNKDVPLYLFRYQPYTLSILGKKLISARLTDYPTGAEIFIWEEVGDGTFVKKVSADTGVLTYCSSETSDYRINIKVPKLEKKTDFNVWVKLPDYSDSCTE